jgi:pimeloyl-ACP methyl ester carboxylesterase
MHIQKEILIDGSKITYRVIGKGMPVVLIHGFGEDGEVWNNQIEVLKDQCQLIVPDLPGSGKSEMVEDMSIEGLAESIKKILDIEIFKPLSSSAVSKKIYLIGHSMGGYIALAYAEKYGEQLEGLGLFHSSAFADSEEKKTIRQKGIEFIKQNGAFEFLKTVIPNLFSIITKEKNPSLVQKLLDKASNFSNEALVSYYTAMMQRPDRTAVLKNARIPILLIFGEYDTAVPLSDSLKLCRLPELSYIHLLQKSGHMGMCEESEKSTQVIAKYLTDRSIF